jgi:hypothetical protein
VGESPGSRSTNNPYPGDGDVVGGLLHDACHSPPASSLARSGWPVEARGSLADMVGVEVLAHTMERAVFAHDRLRAQGCQAHGPQQNECTPYVISNLHH